MAENELIIEISADTIRLIQGLDKGAEAIDDFANTGKISINKLNDALRAIRDAAFSSTDVAEIRRLGQAYREVQEQGRRLNDVFNNVEESTRRSRIAVYGLNQVVRDLPFGFIAISNNIPVLIDQLAELRRNTGSTGGAIKSFLSGLVGFGGISILLSATISLVTTAVQKYGSLGAAFRELTGSISATERVQLSFNKALSEGAGEVAVQVSRLTTLNNLSKDASIGINNQKYATQLLVQEIDKLIVSQDLQKQGISEVSGELLDYAKKIVIVRANIKGFNAVIDELGVQFAKAQLEGVTFTDYLVAGAKKVFAFTDAVRQGNFAYAKQVLELDFVQVAQLRYQKRLEELTDAQRRAQKASEEYIKTETKNGIQLIDILGDGIKAEADAEKERLKAAKTRDQLAKKEARDAISQRAKDAKETLAVLKTQLDAQKAYVSSLSLLDKTYLSEKLEILDLEFRIKRLNIEAEISDKRKLNEALLNLERQFASARIALVRDTELKIKKAREEFQESQYQITDVEANENALKQAVGQINRLEKETKRFGKINKENFQLGEYQKQVEQITAVFNQTLGPAIDGVFNAIANGEDVLKNIGESFKRLALDIAATIVKTLLLKAIISAINPTGALFAGVAGGAGGFLQGIVNTLTGFNSAAPSGGINIQGPGGFGLSGQVVFVQRGADLVGVLNQTSARIGRIG